jgi:hypothetical protein
MLFINRAYTFRSPSATFLRVYNIKEYNKKLCVASQSKIWIYKILYNSKILDVITKKWWFLIRHTTFTVLFSTVHPEDSRRRWPKHVGVLSKQRV